MGKCSLRKVVPPYSATSVRACKPLFQLQDLLHFPSQQARGQRCCQNLQDLSPNAQLSSYLQDVVIMSCIRVRTDSNLQPLHKHLRKWANSLPTDTRDFFSNHSTSLPYLSALFKLSKGTPLSLAAQQQFFQVNILGAELYFSHSCTGRGKAS